MDMNARFCWRAALVSIFLALSAGSRAADPVVGGPLLDAIEAVPAGQWTRINLNSFSAAWTPADLRPLERTSNPTPSKIIGAWSGYAWDTRRGDMIIYGGGHANYSGNDVYRWRSSTLEWERASLPSQVVQLSDTGAYAAIDGADNAPTASHTYDNNVYLPLADRFMTWGGALYNTGSYYVTPDENIAGALRKTGPYFFDPGRADPDEVGGTTGSHVQRVAPYANIVGGKMWQNRDHWKNIPTQPQLRHVNGCTAYAVEGGRDIVYVGARLGGTALDLFRYTLQNVDDPTTDLVEKVGKYYYGTSNQTACGYSPERKLFVRTGNLTYPFDFWDITNAGPSNRDQLVQVNPSIAAFADWLAATGKVIQNCGLDYDPGDGSFAVWCGGVSVWRLRPPPTNVAAGWTISEEGDATGNAPPDAIASGVLGKWKYIPGYDVLMALEGPNDGNVWFYKPVGWVMPKLGDPVNWAPESVIITPQGGEIFDLGAAVPIIVDADDVDGAIAKMELLVNGKSVATLTRSPWQFSWIPGATGAYALRVRVTDDRGGIGASQVHAVQVLPPNVPPTVDLTAPLAGAKVPLGSSVAISAHASDTDGVVVGVGFYVNGNLLANAASAPYSTTWTPTQTGSYAVEARATDNRNATTSSQSLAVEVLPPDQPPSVSLVAPDGKSTYRPGVAVALSASAADADGFVASVEFLVDGSPVAQVSSAPWDATWTPAQAGTFTLTARATDNLGARQVSSPISIVVDNAGTTQTVVLQQGLDGYAGTTDVDLYKGSPTGNFGESTVMVNSGANYSPLIRFAVFRSEGGPIPDGSTIVSAKLEIYKDVYNYVYRVHPLLRPWNEQQATWNVAASGSPWASAGASGIDTDYASAADAEYSAPWQSGWMTFDVTARLRDQAQGGQNLGWKIVGVSGYNAERRFYSSEYATVALRPKLTLTFAQGSGDARPTAAITAPSPGQDFKVGSDVVITADASDSDGSVTKVEFYVDAVKQGEALSPPYGIHWTPSAQGTHSLTAKAYDNGGNVTTSQAVSVVVTPAAGSPALVTLQQGMNGYGGTSDAVLSSYYPNTNYGASTTFTDGKKYANLVRFAIFASEGGPVPDGATIVSAVVEIYKDVYNYQYRLHPLLKSWDEMQSTWNVARTGVPWSAPGASGVGMDYSSSWDAEYAAPWEAGWMPFDVTARVQAIAAGAANNGWRVVDVSGYETTRYFYASEYSVDATLRPRLKVSYLP
jgi:hypothetical protein